ncbi:MAG: hypothetical protein ACOX5G_07930 [Kiritimatiellia bacterium]|jgi:hypothetical protein
MSIPKSFPAALPVLCMASMAFATHPGQRVSTPIARAMVDVEHSAVWVEGAETKDGYISSERVLWTRDDRIHSPYGEHFSDAAKQGPRHLRYAFTEPVPVGSLFACTGDRVTLLREDAPFPGDMADESHWIDGERLEADGRVVSGKRDGYIVWTFPEGTRTRAVRVSHVPGPLDPDRRGWVNSLLLLPYRCQPLSMFARVHAEVNPNSARKIVNQVHDGLGQTWSNVSGRQPIEELPMVDKENPGIVWLSWPEAVSIDSIVAIHTGFGAVEVDAFRGPGDRDPGTAREDDWEFVQAFDGMELNFPTTWPNVMNFDKTLTTRAIRLRMVDKMVCGHDHVKNENRGGKRVYLDELLVLRRMGKGEPFAAPAFAARLNKPLTPPIPVRFRLPDDGFVTLVIEDADGKRIRNLIADTPFKKGRNVVWWDGTDDLGRDVDAAGHGVFRIPPQAVEPGTYTVRGLWHKGIRPVYEFGVYAPGRWVAGDDGSGWLANHCNPQAAAFVPAELSPLGEPLAYLGALVTEGPHGFIWVDMEGNKRGGLHWIGGNWVAAPFIASDCGPSPDPESSVFVAGCFGQDGDDSISEIRINAIRKEDARRVRQVGRIPISDDFKGDKAQQLAGLAVYDNVVAFSLPLQDAVWFVGGGDGAIRRKAENLPNPRGIAFDPADGSLLVLSGNRIVRLPPDGGEPSTLAGDGLEDPRGIAVSRDDGSIYVSDCGNCHQVKVFDRQGGLVRTVGRAGVPKAGPYDELQMHCPHGIAIDNRNRLWVAENDSMPKRVSLWDDQGNLLRAWYGPAKYGEGGTIDSVHPERFYYADGGGTLEFAIDWETGESRLVNVLARNGDYGFPCPGGYGDWGGMPEYAVYRKGRRYLSNCYNNCPIAAPSTMSVYLDNGDGTMRPCVSMGRADNWRAMLDREEFHARWPDPDNRSQGFYIWCDQNDDGRVQPPEVAIDPNPGWGPILMPDLAVTVSNFRGQAIRLHPQWAGDSPVPRYDLDHLEVLAENVYGSMSDGGDYVLADDSDEVVMTKGAAPFSPYSFTGTKKGKVVWSYPTLWPGLHASHSAPAPSEPGQLFGTVRNLGPMFSPKGAKVGPVWLMSGNTGSVYLFTRDGLFVTSVFGDGRQCQRLNRGVPVEKRGLVLENFTLDGENFWPTSTCTPDGTVYITACSRVMRVDGLDTMRRIRPFTIKVTPKDLEKARSYRVATEKQRREREGSGLLRASILPQDAVAIDGTFDDWNDAVRVDIERQGVHAFFDSNSAPFDIRGAAAVAGTNLCLLWETGNRDLLRNSGENPIALFKTGGCLDFMLGTDASADPDRPRPVDGDLRLLVTRVGDQTKALVYRQVVADPDPARRVPFSSPSRTIPFDRVDDVGGSVALAWDDQGRFELSIPLDLLGLAPEDGLRLKADIGVLRGDNHVTIARNYWSNKSTNITKDVPSEAELMPALWGTLEFSE